MIDIESETLLTLREARRLFRGRSGNPHPATIYRWVTVGCRGIVLESLPQGGLLCTSREAVARFLASLAASRRSEPTRASAAQRRAAKRRQEAAAKEAGSIVG